MDLDSNPNLPFAKLVISQLNYPSYRQLPPFKFSSITRRPPTNIIRKKKVFLNNKIIISKTSQLVSPDNDLIIEQSASLKYSIYVQIPNIRITISHTSSLWVLAILTVRNREKFHESFMHLYTFYWKLLLKIKYPFMWRIESYF